MAHGIINEEMFSVRELPWHGLGKVLEEAPNSADAIRYAGLDWQVEQKQLFYERPDSREAFMDLIPSGYMANIRSDTLDILGVVTNRYQVVQNHEAFAFADALLDGGNVRYETAGALFGGKKVWLLARMPSHYILDDEINTYLCFTHGHDGRNPIVAAITNIRVVCNNTLNAALRGTKRMWTSKHIGNMDDKLAIAKMQLNLVRNYNLNLSSLAVTLYQIKIKPYKLDYYINNLFPLTDVATKRVETNINHQRDELLYRWQEAPDLENFRHTGWGFVSAVSDYVSHAMPLRETKAWREHRMNNLIAGPELLDKAISLVKAA